MRIFLFIVALLLPSLFFAQAAKPSTGETAKPAPTLPPDPSTVNEPKAIFHTTAGNITCVLFKKQAPITVANFIGLATGKKEWTNPVSHAKKVNTPLYDGTIFHRVIPKFMIQGGDPAGNGAGDPGFTIPDEFRSGLKFDRPGRLAMANIGEPNTGGSQFFITVAPTPWLNGKHTIFGQCEPVSIANRIADMPRDPATDRPFNPVRITDVQIIEPHVSRSPARRSTTTHRRATVRKPLSHKPPAQQ